MIKRNVIVPIAAAVSALSGTLPVTQSNAPTWPDAALEHPTGSGSAEQPNTLVSTGRDLLGFTIDERADGTIVAQHSSHASHASHHSHYSRRPSKLRAG